MKKKESQNYTVPLGISSPCRRKTEPRPQATCTKNW